MRILRIDEVLAAPDIQEKEIDIPEWGGAVKIKGFTKKEIEIYRRESNVDGEMDAAKLEELWFVHGLVEPAMTSEQYQQLLNKPAGPYFKILNAILAESGLMEEVRKQAVKSFRTEA